MRLLKVGSITLEVTAQQEADWPRLASCALLAAQAGRSAAPTVMFVADTGAIGSIPISDRARVEFVDDELADGHLGAITHLGPETEQFARRLAEGLA